MPTTARANHNHHQDTPLSDYFLTMEDPLRSGDPFGTAWDADLDPEEYGDQSGDWHDDDHSSFSSHDDDSVLSDDDNDDDDDWNIVYSASFTVVASTTPGNPAAPPTAACNQRQSKINTTPRKRNSSALAAVVQHETTMCTTNSGLTRRDSKVRFCEGPPVVNCYETCSRDQYSELYYSVHELQKIIDDLRQETNNGNNTSSNMGRKGKAQTTTGNLNGKARAATPSRSA